MHITYPPPMSSRDRNCLSGTRRRRLRSQGPSSRPSVDPAQPPRPPIRLPMGPEALDRSTLNQQALPWVRPPTPSTSRVARGAGSVACLLSVPKPGLCSLALFPPSLMFYSCKPSLHLSSED